MGPDPSKKTPLSRASTVTATTSLSQLIRSASKSRRRTTSISTGSTLVPPSEGSLRRSTTTTTAVGRASTVIAATSTSRFLREGAGTTSIPSTLSSPLSSSSATTPTLLRSPSKRGRASSFLSTATSRLLYGRPPPGHATLRPNQIATFTRTLSFPSDTPMMSSIIAAMGPPLSRSQFSAPDGGFCDAHFWLERRYVVELTEVIAHEMGPQLDRLRMAPGGLVSRKTKRLLERLEPYRNLFAGVCENGSVVSSSKPVCPACTLSSFLQDAVAVHALSTCVKGRKHRNRPWPSSMAWLEPCPGKGADWEAKWKTEGKAIGRDRSRVQRWRRANRLREPVPEEHLQVSGHEPGEGCDFCDSLRMEQADEEELDAAIAEEDEEEGAVGSLGAGVDDDDEDTVVNGDDEDDDETVTLRDSTDSETIRAREEERIIKDYLRSSSLSSKNQTDSVYDSLADEGALDHWDMQETQRQVEEDIMGFLSGIGDKGEAERNERARKASDWARSYMSLVGRGPASRTTLQFERFPEEEGGWV